jgi:hypothetical protein
MNKRLAMLEKMFASGQADSFAHYALALEYRKENRAQDALRIFQVLRDKDPGYLPMYLMAGQMLRALERGADAREWLGSGIALATRNGDMKARGELESELAALE